MSCASAGMAVLNLSVKRNGVLRRNFYFTDDNGDALDLTGWSAKMQVRSALGASSSIFTLVETPNGNDSYIDITDATAGEVEVFVSNDDIDLVPEASATTDAVVYAYDIVLTDTAGDFMPFVGGTFTVIPGVTL